MPGCAAVIHHVLMAGESSSWELTSGICSVTRFISEGCRDCVFELSFLLQEPASIEGVFHFPDIGPASAPADRNNPDLQIYHFLRAGRFKQFVSW